MYNMKALALLIQKLWPRLKFFKNRSNIKVTRNAHMKYERRIVNGFIIMAKVKFLSTQPT